MLKLITFDVTGTLLRFKSGVGQQYAEILQKVAKLTCDPHTLNISFAKAYRNHSKAYPFFGKDEELPIKTWWRSVFYQTLFISGIIKSHEGAILSNINIVSSKQLKNSHSLSVVEDAFESVYKNFAYETVPYAHELLEFIKKNTSNVTGVITNSDNRVHTELKNAGLIDYFDFIVTSTKCGCEKPGRQIFDCALQMAAKHKNQEQYSISASSSLHIGDNLDEDYYGAIKAGFSALMLDPQDKYSKIINPNHCIKDLSCVFHYLKNKCL